MKDVVGQSTQAGANAQVRKALDDTEKKIVGDIRALLNKLDQAEAAEEQPAADAEASPANDLLAMAMKAAEATGIGEDGEPKTPKDEDDKVAKADANDTAEVRIKEDNPEANDAITLVGKALLSLLSPQQRVAKSARTEIDEGLVSAINKIANQTAVNTRALEGILQGINAAELIEKSATVPARKVVQQSPNMLAEALAQVLKSQAGGDASRIGGRSEESVGGAEGTMADVLKTLAVLGPQKIGPGNS